MNRFKVNCKGSTADRYSFVGTNTQINTEGADS